MYQVLMLFIFLIIVYFIITSSNASSYNIIEGLNTFNGRMAISDQYYYDKLFDDVIYYPNKYEKDYETGEEIGKLLKTGWQECREKCTYCVEFGVSGNAWCLD